MFEKILKFCSTFFKKSWASTSSSTEANKVSGSVSNQQVDRAPSIKNTPVSSNQSINRVIESVQASQSSPAPTTAKSSPAVPPPPLPTPPPPPQGPNRRPMQQPLVHQPSNQASRTAEQASAAHQPPQLPQPPLNKPSNIQPARQQAVAPSSNPPNHLTNQQSLSNQEPDTEDTMNNLRKTFAGIFGNTNI